MENKAKCFGNVLNIHVAPHLLTLTVDGELSAGQGQLNKLWDQLFGILPRTVDIVASGDDDWQVVRDLVRVAKHLRPGLGGSIRVCWAHGCLGFVKLAFVLICLNIFAVHFVRTDVNEPLDAAVANLVSDLSDISAYLSRT